MDMGAYVRQWRIGVLAVVSVVTVVSIAVVDDANSGGCSGQWRM